jgi:hypothetical protein
MSNNQLQIGLMWDDWVDLSPPFISLLYRLLLECFHDDSRTRKQVEKQNYMINKYMERIKTTDAISLAITMLP